MKTLALSSRGNAVLISVAVTGFLFLAAAGASKIILGSLKDSPKVVESHEALYAAESALEAALYEAKGRGPGYQAAPGGAAGEANFVSLNRVNNSSGSWQANGQSEAGRDNFDEEAVPEYRRTLFIPPRQVVSSSTEVKNDDLANWKKVRFGEKVQLDLYIEDAASYTPKPLILGTDDTVTSGGTGNTTLPAGVFLGPRGLRSDHTRSIMGLPDYNNRNDQIEHVFFDLFLPINRVNTQNENDNRALLSWQLEVNTDGGDGLPPALKLYTTNACGDTAEKAGAICFQHFDHDSTNIAMGSITLNKPQGQPEFNGMWVRLTDPTGILAKDGEIVEDAADNGLVNFLNRNSPYDYLAAQIAFPRLTLQLGQPVKADGSAQLLTEAYIRVGIQLKSSADMSNAITNFPLPDDKITINATGASGVVKRGVKAEIHPQEGAPMFDYSVFQP